MQELIGLLGLLGVVAAITAAMGFRGRDQVVGIDLGTTFSVVALKSNDRVTVLPDYITGRQLVPSMVTYLSNGSLLVGGPAAEVRGSLPLNTIFNAKRFIGRTLGEVSEDAADHPFQVRGNESSLAEGLVTDINESAAGFWVPSDVGISGYRWISPIDVGAEVVKHLRKSVQAYLGHPISRAVICVPAKFSYRETKATQLAFEKAGIKVARVLEEPTAAAVAYNLHKVSSPRHVLVYDIGGGTLDTSLLYSTGRSLSVLGVAGDDHLGGSDFDHRTHHLLERKLRNATEGPAEPRPTQMCSSDGGLLALAEQAKIRLSSDLKTEVRCLKEDGGALVMVVTREEFEEASKDLFDRSMAPVAQVLQDQMMTPDIVDDVVLVGGASRTPKLRQLLQEFFGPTKRLHTDIDPDVTIAYGAANILD